MVLALLSVAIVGAPPSDARGRAGTNPSALAAHETILPNQGVGSYTDISVGNQISTFTINPTMVSCGVGTIAAGQWSGPFAMLMYALDVHSYKTHGSTIRASGSMRSITTVAGETVEDVNHRFLAVALDGRSEGPDRFDVHFKTPFWNTGNKMCTASPLVPGGCRFGGQLVMGDVAVGK